MDGTACVGEGCVSEWVKRVVAGDVDLWISFFLFEISLRGKEI